MSRCSLFVGKIKRGRRLFWRPFLVTSYSQLSEAALLHVDGHFVHRFAFVAAELVSRGRDDFYVVFRDAGLFAQHFQQVRIAFCGHLRKDLHHVVLVDFGGVFLGVGLESLAAFLDFFNGPIIQFIQLGLVVRFFIVVNFELLNLVFPGGLARVVILRVGEDELRVFSDGFGHLDGLCVLFARECIAVRVNQHFVVFAKADAECASSCAGEVADELEWGKRHFDEQVHDGLPDNLAVREFRVVQVALDRNIELDFVVFVLENCGFIDTIALTVKTK